MSTLKKYIKIRKNSINFMKNTKNQQNFADFLLFICKINICFLINFHNLKIYFTPLKF